jgi:hypothetical protein
MRCGFSLQEQTLADLCKKVVQRLRFCLGMNVDHATGHDGWEQLQDATWGSLAA